MAIVVAKSQRRSIWQTVVGWIRAQSNGEQTVSKGLAYEGASMSRRARGWMAPTLGPNSGVLGSLGTLRDRSRQAVRNDGYAARAVDRLVSNMVGTGIKPLSQAADPGFRAQVHALWLEWTDFSDADGVLDFYGQQALAVRTWLEGGESFTRLRPRRAEDGLPVPLQLQIIEPEICPHTHNGTAGANRIRAGIEFTPIGARAAYWMYRVRPGSLFDYETQDLVRVRADEVIHLYDPVRAGQIRGLPHLTQTLIRLRELDEFDDATLVRQKLANLFAGFVTRPAGESDTGINPLTGQPIETEDGQALVGLEPGIFQELAPGQSVTFNDPPDAGDTYAPFTKQQLLAIATAADVPYEVLTGDVGQATDRALRVILAEFRRRIQQRQHQIIVYQFCRKLWQVWFDRAVLSGALEIPGGAAAYQADPKAFRAVRWVPPGWPYLQPVQDVEAQRAAIRAGFRSRADVVSELGEDVEVVDAEIAADQARADALGLRLDSDPRYSSASGSQQPAPAVPDSD